MPGARTGEGSDDRLEDRGRSGENREGIDVAIGPAQAEVQAPTGAVSPGRVSRTVSFACSRCVHRPDEVPDRRSGGHGVAALDEWRDRLVCRSQSGPGVLDGDDGGAGHSADEGNLPVADGPDEASGTRNEVNSPMAPAPRLLGRVEPLLDAAGGDRPRPQPGEDERGDPGHVASLAARTPSRGCHGCRGARCPSPVLPVDEGASYGCRCCRWVAPRRTW